MLVLTRKPLEAVIIAEPQNLERRLKVTVLEVFNGKVRLGFEVDPDVVVHRAEVWEKVFAGWQSSAASTDPVVASMKNSDSAMKIGQTEGHSLFTSTSPDGINWLFIILPDDRWVITQNGKRVTEGRVDRASINAGVQKFMLFTSVLTNVAIEAGQKQDDAEMIRIG